MSGKYHVSAARNRIQISAINLVQFGDPANSDIDLRNFIPGAEAHDTILRQIKNPLEGFYGFLGGRAKDAILCDFWYQWIAVGYHIELSLHLAYFFT